MADISLSNPLNLSPNRPYKALLMLGSALLWLALSSFISSQISQQKLIWFAISIIFFSTAMWIKDEYFNKQINYDKHLSVYPTGNVPKLISANLDFQTTMLFLLLILLIVVWIS